MLKSTITRVRDRVSHYLRSEQQDAISEPELNRLLDEEEKKHSQPEASPWLEFERRWKSADQFVFLVPEAWRVQPLPHGGYVELRYQVDGDVLSSISGRAIWPNGLPEV